MKRQKYFENIPYTVQVCRFLGAGFGLLLIGAWVMNASASLRMAERGQSLLPQMLVLTYGLLLALPWKRFSLRRVWHPLFLTFALVSLAFLAQIVAKIVEVFRAEGPDRFSYLLFGVLLASFMVSQLASNWTIRRRKQELHAEPRKERALVPVPQQPTTDASPAAEPRPFVWLSHREKFLGSLVVCGVLLLHLFGLLASLSVPPVPDTVYLHQAIEALVEYGFSAHAGDLRFWLLFVFEPWRDHSLVRVPGRGVIFERWRS